MILIVNVAVVKQISIDYFFGNFTIVASKKLKIQSMMKAFTNSIFTT
jgi:hypothetical protein